MSSDSVTLLAAELNVQSVPVSCAVVLTVRWWRIITDVSGRFRTWRRSWTTRPTLWQLTDETSLRCVWQTTTPSHQHLHHANRVNRRVCVCVLGQRALAESSEATGRIRSTSASVISFAPCSVPERWICTQRRRWGRALSQRPWSSHTLSEHHVRLPRSLIHNSWSVLVRMRRLICCCLRPVDSEGDYFSCCILYCSY